MSTVRVPTEEKCRALPFHGRGSDAVFYLSANPVRTYADGNSAFQQYGYNSRTWPHGWPGFDSASSA
jgi:hypothetical protein